MTAEFALFPDSLHRIVVSGSGAAGLDIFANFFITFNLVFARPSDSGYLDGESPLDSWNSVLQGDIDRMPLKTVDYLVHCHQKQVETLTIGKMVGDDARDLLACLGREVGWNGWILSPISCACDNERLGT